MSYEGGYILDTSLHPLISGSIHQHTAALNDPISDTTLRALNALQDTPWSINTWITDIISRMYEAGIECPGVPLSDDEPIEERIDGAVWDAMGAVAQNEAKADRMEVYARNAKRAGRRAYLRDCLSVATAVKDHPAIWFPHFLDFRTRLYPSPSRGPHPQASDIGKSMIHFAHGKPLGEHGLYWLEFRAANCAGMDKLPFEERLAWVAANVHNIGECASDPIGMRGWWAEMEPCSNDPVMDEPWGFLATCRELAEAWSSPDPTKYVSHLPIPLDGSCNGLQHLALLGRDSRAARSTNLTDDPERHDIYAEIAATVSRMVADDAVSGKVEAVHWAGEVSRKVCKRSVMTTPYGVTPLGIRDQLVADGHVKSAPGGMRKGPLANYLRDKLVATLGEALPGPKAIMAWLQEVATILAKNNQPIRWMTPAGSIIQQSYYKMNVTNIHTLSGDVQLWDENPRGGINPSKSALSAAPNVIHSFDAAHMQVTICALLDKGVRHFAMIHDSYGTHAADADTMGQTLRETLVSIYSTDHLERLWLEFVDQIPPEVELPLPPEMGDFDIYQVLLSSFCFA